MRFQSLASVALLALATKSVAEQIKPFRMASVSLRQLGLFPRDEDGYQPEDEACQQGGNTCAEACGAGYEQCTSGDSAVHCYNPAAGESCCSTGSGSSCLAAYRCTHDATDETLCCPVGLSLEECAAELGATGALTLDVPKATSTSTTSTTSSKVTTSTTTSEVTTTSSESTTTFAPSSGIVSSAAVNSTVTTSSSTRTATGPATVTDAPPSAGHANSPVILMVVAAAGFVAALL